MAATKKSNMEVFKFEVKEYLSRIVDVEAENIDEALSKVKALYRNEEIVLDSSDYVTTEINLSE